MEKASRPKRSLEQDGDPLHHPLGQPGEYRHLMGALLLTLGFACVEAVAGWRAGSLALIADAGHMLTDSTALALAALAAWLARRPPSARHTYGLVRAEVLAALVNGLIMLVLIGFIVFEAVARFSKPHDIQGETVIVVALLGLIINLLVAWRLSRGSRDLNTRAALLHVVSDLLGSVAAIISGAVIMITGWTPIDPVLSLLVAGLILVSAWRLLSEALHVLLEGVPQGIDLQAVGHSLAAVEGVLSVHDLHIWTLSSGKIALSAHLDLDRLEDWPFILLQARRLLFERYGIGHVTLQPEVRDNPVIEPLPNRYRRL